jgi:hypothetical protein
VFAGAVKINSGMVGMVGIELRKERETTEDPAHTPRS